MDDTTVPLDFYFRLIRLIGKIAGLLIASPAEVIRSGPSTQAVLYETGAAVPVIAQVTLQT
jgi:hypothetical protein